MSTDTRKPRIAARRVKYPDSDGRPMSDNTRQYEWIATIKGGLDAVFRDDPNAFVAGDILWYPTRGKNKLRLAPDVLVALGRPKGYRGSYMQWREGNQAPQVVFEILSPRNRPRRMEQKRAWHFRFGAEEYYEFNPDPDRLSLRGSIREGQETREIEEMSGWTSPRLGLRFELGDDLTIIGPDGRPFATYVELFRQRNESEQWAEQEHQRADREFQRAEQEQLRAEQDRLRADRESQRAEQESQRAEQERLRAEQERLRAEQESQRAERLAARLRELGLEPDE